LIYESLINSLGGSGGRLKLPLAFKQIIFLP